MLVRCVHCDAELVAPVRSEYWSDKHACHIWLCPKCCACFSRSVQARFARGRLEIIFSAYKGEVDKVMML